MRSLVAKSKTDQVLDYLRREIESQNLNPGDKLLSISKFANHLSTSEQVIKSAYKIMENEGLIFRSPRKGVFVNKRPTLTHIKEIYILGVNLKKTTKPDKEILNVINPLFFKSDFSYTTRIYSPEIAMEKALNIEVDKINNRMRDIDCVLINAAPLKRKNVEKCLQINKPVIFLGDFKSRKVQDLNYNQITGDNAYLAEQHVQYLYDNKYESITLFSGSLQHFFNNNFFEGAVAKAKKLGLKLNIIEFPKGISDKPYSSQKKTIEKIIKQFLQKNPINNGCIIQGINRTLIQETLLANRKVPFHKILFVPTGDIDYSTLYEEISHRIDELLINPNSKENIRVKLAIKLS